MLTRKVEFVKLLNLSKPGVRRSFIFVEPLHLANYQIHRTSEFVETSNSWKAQIHRTLGPLLRVHRSPTNPCEVHVFSKWRTRTNLTLLWKFHSLQFTNVIHSYVHFLELSLHVTVLHEENLDMGQNSSTPVDKKLKKYTMDMSSFICFLYLTPFQRWRK